MNITAVSGWGLPPEWFHNQVQQSFPGARIQILSPASPANSGEAEELLKSSPADLYIGYSLGSLWLLRYRDCLPRDARKALLAPILGFTKEKRMGGKTSKTQLKYLIKVLKRDPENNEPLLNFYASCEFSFSDSFLQTVPARDVLLKGLEFLLSVSESGSSAADFLALLGENDLFIDGSGLNTHIPHLQIVQGAGHAPEKLLKALAANILIEKAD